MVAAGSLLGGLPSLPLPEELVETLCRQPGARIERIVSTGQATPDGQWYDQDTDEWVLLVRGGARLRIEGEPQDRALAPGDYLLLPAHCRHRVTWTERDPPTIWLAVHFSPTAYTNGFDGWLLGFPAGLICDSLARGGFAPWDQR